jgi:hypothetical protein
MQAQERFARPVGTRVAARHVLQNMTFGIRYAFWR